MTLTTERQDLHRLVDALPDSEIPAARRYLRYLRQMAEDPVLKALMQAPIDDEPLAEQDLADLEEARRAYRRGEVVSSEEVRRELGI